ncbi:MAG: hypothetical protein CMF23_18035 [Ignavibacteriae bacterium]|nr:hypothetical protein [Ignavibacteriota bacterium]
MAIDEQNFVLEFRLEDNFGEFSKTLKGLDNLSDFIEKESNYWSKFNNLGYINSIIYRNDEIQKLIKSIRDIAENKKQFSQNEKQFVEKINTLQSKVSEKHINGRSEMPIMYSNTELAETYISLASIEANYAENFINYLNNNRNGHIQTNYKSLISLISAAVYRGDINFSQRAIKYENKIRVIVDEYKNNLDKFSNESNEIKSKFISEFKDRKEEIKNWFEKEKKYIESEKNRIGTEFTELKKFAEGKVNENEHLFREKLMLEKPVEHWETRAKYLERENKKWLFTFGMGIAIAIIALTAILYFPPDIFKVGLDGKIKLENIKGVILFVSILSLFGIFIKVLSKLTFSNIHLMRDAEERKMLTYFYLSLKVETKDMGDEERKLILQSLFSTADFGILTKESGPTMPGITELIKSVNGH